MPRVSQYLIRIALLQLALGATIGGLLLAEKGLQVAPWLWVLRPVHVEVLLVGWVVQLACGVAIWILPRLDAAGSRGNLGLAWLACGALNGGVALVGLHAPLALAGLQNLNWMLAVAGALHALAVVAMAAHLWRRVLPFRELPRPARPAKETS